VYSISLPKPRHARDFLRALVGLLCCGVCAVCWAGRPVRVYEVDLKGGQTPAALQEAMREALVRATGRRESAEDPALGSLLANASMYVKAYTSGPRGESQVVFDSAAVEHAVTAAGRPVWERDRPFTLVVLSPAPPRPAEDAARTSLEQVATERGLPISLVPLVVTDASGNELGREAVMQVAQRYGGDAVLLGHGDPSIAGAQMQWTLYTNYTSQSWTGPLEAGINGTVDNLAPPVQGGSLADSEATAIVQIDGLNNLTDYAVAARLLEGMPGARRASVIEARGSTASFDVTVRGGVEAIDRALTGSGKFVRAQTSDSHPVFQYRSQ
jgi:uncharacterized protein